nr:glycine zipper 2TM domain-containing protein [uncultured Sphingorhabdus sp.]
MMKSILALAAASLVVPAGAVLADPPAHAKAWGYKDKKGRAYDRGYREGRRDAQRLGSNARVWRGDDGRYYCKRDDGTTGLIIGAAVGGLAGNEIAGRGDKTLGAILGAAGGALLGREIDRSNYRCR